MPNFTVDEMRKVMGVPINIRNMSVIAHVAHQVNPDGFAAGASWYHQ